MCSCEYNNEPLYVRDVLKDKACSNNPCAECDLEKRIQDAVFSFSRAEFQCAVNTFVWCDACQ